MKRLIGAVVVVSVLLTAGIANANFMYYLQPVAGGTASYTTTFTPNTSGVGSWSVNIASSSTVGQTVEMVLYAAVPGTSTGNMRIGYSLLDYLNISNTAATGSGTLIGSFLTNGSSTNGNGYTGDGNGDTGTPGVVSLNGDASLGANQGNGAGGGNAANVAWYGGQLNTVANGAGWVGGAAQNTNTGITGAYVCPDGGSTYNRTGAVLETAATGAAYYVTPTAAITTKAGAAGSTLAGASWYDIPLGTLYYELAKTPSSGQTAAIDIQQVPDTGGNYYGAYAFSSSSGTGTTTGQKSMTDEPVTIAYGNVSPDTSVLDLTPASLSLGRLLLGSTAYITSSGSIANTTSVANTGYTLTPSGITLKSATSGSLAASTSTALSFNLPSSAGPISATVTLLNTGNSSDPNNGTAADQMSVTGFVVANRPMSVPSGIPVAGSYLQGTIVNLTLTDGGGLPNNANTMPNVNQLSGSPATFPGHGGVYVNAIGTSVISASNPSATLQMVFSATGSYTSGSIDLGAGGIVTQETGLLPVGNTAIPAGTYTLPVNAYTIGLASLGVPLTGSGPTAAAMVLNASLSSFLTHANGSLHTNGTTATLYGYGLSNVAMQWRVATSSDLTALTGAVSGGSIASDVVNVKGISSSQAFIMQMQYDYAGNANIAAANGKLFLGYLVPGGTWTNPGTDYLGNQPFSQVFGGVTSLSNYIGDWGFDSSTKTAWVVLNGLPTSSNGSVDFAVPAATVPEPASLILLAAAGLAGGLVWRRKRA
jgi:hypothetical protein